MTRIGWLLAAALALRAMPARGAGGDEGAVGGGAAPAAAAPAVEAAARPQWLLYLRDGRVLRGEVVDRGADSLTLIVTKTGERLVLVDTLVRRVDGPPLPPRCQPGDGRLLVAVMKDGRSVTGRLTRRCEGAFTLEDEAAHPVELREDDVRSLGAPGGEPSAGLPPAPEPPSAPWRADVARGRMLASPTGLAPAAGELVLSTAQAQVALEAGVLPWLSLSAATTPQLAYARALGDNATVSAAAGGSWRWLHGRAGVRGDFGAGGFSAAYVYGTVTAGGPDRNLTVYAGPPLPGAALAGTFRDRILAVGGAWRLASWASAATEHWVALDGGRDTAHALAFRFMAEPIAFEVGGIGVTGAGRWLPWLGVSWRLRRGE
ncbi:MAG TPA: hypothetical protein VFP50_12315 [Anaeromyxobacteraceae bacterium]|nr:hypothetical protein [Anaeromyxobacteraceae bacterium]